MRIASKSYNRGIYYSTGRLPSTHCEPMEPPQTPLSVWCVVFTTHQTDSDVIHTGRGFFKYIYIY